MSTTPEPPPTTTIVTGRARRPWSLDGFDDLTGGVAASGYTYDEAKRQTTLTFPGVLTPKQKRDVHNRLTSIDDVDMADRAAVVELMDAVAAMPESPLTRLALRLGRWRLADQTDGNP